jgi:Protein of unknown function (DUF3618)
VSARTPEEIEADIERAREQLAQTLDLIADRVSPKNVAKRSADRTREQFVYSDGTMRTERIVAAVAVVSLVLGFLLWRRRR